MKNTLIALGIAVCLALAAIAGQQSMEAATVPPYEVWVLDQSKSDLNDNPALIGNPSAPCDLTKSDCDGRTDDGGYLYVWSGKTKGGINQKPLKIDLAQAARNGVKRNPDGTYSLNPYPIGLRPHIPGHNATAFTTENATHVAINYVAPPARAADGGVLFMRVDNKKAVGWVQAPNIHMPGPSPHDDLLAGVAPAAKKLYVMTTDYLNENFALDSTVDLGTVKQDFILGTPEHDDGATDAYKLESLLGAPANAQCANWTPDSQFVFVTFGKGGLAVFQVKDGDTVLHPPALKEVYPWDVNPGEGCGLLQHPDGDTVFTSGATRAVDQEYVFKWSMGTKDVTPTYMGDGLTNDLLATIPLNPAGRGDSHGPMFTNLGQYMWIAMRMDNEIKVIDTTANTVIRTLPVTRGECGKGDDGDDDDDGLDSDDDDCTPPNLTPDVIDINPQNTLMFVTLRGFCPLTGGINSFVDEDYNRICTAPIPPVTLADGDPLDPVPGDGMPVTLGATYDNGVNPPVAVPLKIETDGRMPGMAVFKVNRDGTRGPLVKIYRISNKVPDTHPANNGWLDVAEPHGLKVVPRAVVP